jgi:hypothetical protein
MTQLIEFVESINILPGLIVSIFLVVINLSALLALIGNIKIPHTQKIIKFKEKRVRLKLTDIPKTFEDWEIHYAEYKEIIKQYKLNYQKLTNKQIEEDNTDQEIEREITPYNINFDVTNVIGKKEKTNSPVDRPSNLKSSTVAMVQDNSLSGQARNSQKWINNNLEVIQEMEEKEYNIDALPEVALFVNPELKDLFDRDIDVTEQHEIMNRNRKKTNIANRIEMDDIDELKKDRTKTSIKIKNTEIEKEKKLDDFITMFKDTTNQWKTIDPNIRKKSENNPIRPSNVIIEDSLNFFDENEISEIQMHPTFKVLNPNGQNDLKQINGLNDVKEAKPVRPPSKFNIFGN